MTDDEIIALLARLAQPLPGRPGHVVVAAKQVTDVADLETRLAVETWALAHAHVMRAGAVAPITGYIIPRTAFA